VQKLARQFASQANSTQRSLTPLRTSSPFFCVVILPFFTLMICVVSDGITGTFTARQITEASTTCPVDCWTIPASFTGESCAENEEAAFVLMTPAYSVLLSLSETALYPTIAAPRAAAPSLPLCVLYVKLLILSGWGAAQLSTARIRDCAQIRSSTLRDDDCRRDNLTAPMHQ
jgi:hypothetical protein